jgi:outer membrane biosynthesis protein TonB
MHLNRGDVRPASMLEGTPVSSGMLVGGVVGILLAHIGLPLAFFAIISGLAASGLADTEPDTFVEEQVIEATFVRLGEKRDPDKLPDRKVPIQQTAPDEAIAISKVNEPPPPEKKEEEKKPEKPIEDPLTRLGDRAQIFAEIQEQRELEGDPNGVEDGTDTEAKAGNIYAGQLSAFLKRGWTVPTTLADTSKLETRVTIEITRDLKIGDFEITRSSGEPVYDQSVEDRLNELKTLQTTLPEPPPEIAEQFLGKQVGFNFKDTAK